MSKEVTEYDGYVIKTPYIGKQLSDAEKAELDRKREDARKEFLAKWANK